MTRHYYVDPADTSAIQRVGPVTGPRGWQVGDAVVLADGTQITGYLSGPAPALGIYLATEATDPVPAYHVALDDTLTFVGTVGSDAARVQETRNTQQIPIAELYDIKRQEIENQDRTVRYNAVDTSLSANWWLIVTELQTTSLLQTAAGSNSRELRGQPWPTGPNAPWVAIYNAATGDARRYQLERGTSPPEDPNPSRCNAWDTLEQEWYLHTQATDNATDASRSALDAAYNNGAGDWQAVADHDPADPAWGYPPTVDPAGLSAAVI